MNKSEITLEDFTQMLGTSKEEILKYCAEEITGANFKYKILNEHEKTNTINAIKEEMNNQIYISRSQAAFNTTFQYYLDKLKKTGDYQALSPKAVRPSIFPFRNPRNVLRLNDDYVLTDKRDFGINFAKVINSYLLKKYVHGCDAVYEFGCGQGYNLVQLARLYPSLKLFGSDWAEPCIEILDYLRNKFDWDITGFQFDLSKPTELKLHPNSIVFTFCSLEQIGKDFKDFIDLLISEKPILCINKEPLVELYPDTELGKIGREWNSYMGYLDGYLPYLYELQEEGTIQIEKVQYVPYGNKYHNAYSYIIWRPV